VPTEIDEGKGLVKVYWEDIRERVANVQPVFANIVDNLGVDKKFPLYLAYYPYGAMKGDTQSTFIPEADGGYYRLSDPNAPREIIKHLGYGIGSAPLAMLLEKNLELFVDLPDEGLIIPRLLYKPGDIFPFGRILSNKNNHKYPPNGVLSLTSGARSVFMLPNIGCATNYCNLQRDFNVQSPPPKFLYDHWNVFREIVNSEVINCPWRSCIMYFSKNWLDQILENETWLKLKIYLHELAWSGCEFQRNRFYYDFAFSMIQKKRNLKPNPYLADTARHLIAIALGAAPGFIPACDDEALPMEIIQNSFIESYGLKKYFSTILRSANFNFEKDKLPVYYSMQYPSTQVFSPKSRKITSTLAEMRELNHIMKIFLQELRKENNVCSDSIMNKIAQKIECNYFHNKIDHHRIIQSSRKIIELDTRFTHNNTKNSDASFASDAPFVRGCISIQSKS